MTKNDKPDVLVVGPPIHPVALERLEREFSPHKYWLASDKPALLASLRDTCRAVVTQSNDGAPGALIEALPKLELIIRYGVGLDSLDIPAATEHGVVVAHYPDFCQPEVANHRPQLGRHLPRLLGRVLLAALVQRAHEHGQLLKGVIVQVRRESCTLRLSRRDRQVALQLSSLCQAE